MDPLVIIRRGAILVGAALLAGPRIAHALATRPHRPDPTGLGDCWLCEGDRRAGCPACGSGT